LRRPATPPLFPYTTLFRSGDLAGHHARGGLAGAGPLEHRPGLVEAVLQHPREVGMAGARARERAVAGDLALVSGAGVDQQILPRHRVGAHDLLPLRPLGVRDLDREGGAEGAAVAQPSVDRQHVLLELLPAAAPVAEATTG